LAALLEAVLVVPEGEGAGLTETAAADFVSPSPCFVSVELEEVDCAADVNANEAIATDAMSVLRYLL
jgi:hypothetical protein